MWGIDTGYMYLCCNKFYSTVEHLLKTALLAIKIWSLKTMVFGKRSRYIDVWDLVSGICGPSKQVLSHGSDLSRQVMVSLYQAEAQILHYNNHDRVNAGTAWLSHYLEESAETRFKILEILNWLQVTCGCGYHVRFAYCSNTAYFSNNLAHWEELVKAFLNTVTFKY